MRRRLQIFGTFLVCLFMVLGIYLLYHDLFSLISQQRNFLEKTAYATSRLIPKANIELASLTKDSHSSNDSQLQDRLFNLQSDLNIIGSLTILDSSRRAVIASTKVGLRKGDAYDLPENLLHSDAPASTPLIRKEGVYMLRAFSPIRDVNGEIVATLALDSDESAFILRLIGYGLHYLLLGLGLITIGGFIFLWISSRTSLSLQKMKERYFTLFRESSDGIIILDENGLIQKVNDAAAEFFQNEEDKLCGNNLISGDSTDFKFITLESSKSIGYQTLELGNHFRSKAKLQLSKDKIRYLSYSSYPLQEGKKIAGALIIFQDITADFVREQELAHDQAQLKSENLQLQQQAITDPLTHCLNRQYLFYLLDEKNLRWMAIEGCSMLTIDIDNFKQINDRQGHSRGDQVLQNFSQFLRSFFRRSDKIIRFGGDEFIVILPRTDLKSALRIANNMLEKLRKMSDHSPSDYITCSIGAAELSPHESGQTWLNRADKAMYEAKNSGKNAIEVSDLNELEILN